MVSSVRPAQRATCVIDYLEARNYCAFGRLDRSWGTNGVLTLSDNRGDLQIAGVLMQPDGKIVVGFTDADDNLIIKRRMLDGSLDRSFGRNGEVRPYENYGYGWEYSLDALTDGTLGVSLSERDGPGRDSPLYESRSQISQDGRVINYGVDSSKLSPVDQTRNMGSQNTRLSLNQSAELFKKYKYDSVLDVIEQGQSDLVAFRMGTQIGITRLNSGTGMIDPSFAKTNSQNQDGVYFLPDQDDLSPEFHGLSDGSIIYTHDIYTGANNSYQIGHLTRDGEIDRSIGTEMNKYRVEFLVSGNNFLWPGGLIVGANDQVYVTFSVDENGASTRPNYIRIYRLNMPMPRLGRITGKLFNDLNSDGKQQASEQSIAGRRVFIDENQNNIFDTGEWSVITDEGGTYVFNNVIAGTYNVCRMLPAGYKVTSSVFSRGSITVKTGQTVTANIGSAKI